MNFHVAYDETKVFHETNLLKLNCDDANNILGWKPILTGERLFGWTSKWYKAMLKDEKNITLDQVLEYLSERKNS